jgi:hypothetical protein
MRYDFDEIGSILIFNNNLMQHSQINGVDIWWIFMGLLCLITFINISPQRLDHKSHGHHMNTSCIEILDHDTG